MTAKINRLKQKQDKKDIGIQRLLESRKKRLTAFAQCEKRKKTQKLFLFTVFFPVYDGQISKLMTLKQREINELRKT